MRDLAPGRRPVVDGAVYATTPLWDDSGSRSGRSKRGGTQTLHSPLGSANSFHCQLLVT